MRATATRVIERPIDVVWRRVSNLEVMAGWVDGVSDVEPPVGELAVGSGFSSRYTYRGKPFDFDYQVTAYDPPNRLDIIATEGPFPFEGSLRLAEVVDGTEVSNTVDAGSDSLATSVIFAVFGPVVRRLMRRQLAGELDSLAEIVEGTEPATVRATGSPPSGRPRQPARRQG